MTKEEFILLMQFPQEWVIWNMYPDELSDTQLKGYEPGHEKSSEHDRNGAFHWWLRRNPDKDILMKLLKLSSLDPDQDMATDVRSYICQANNADEEILKEANRLFEVGVFSDKNNSQADS